MDKLQRIALKLNELGSFFHALTHGLTNGRSDCDHEDLYFSRDAFKTKMYDRDLPIPLVWNVINLRKAQRTKLIASLPQEIKKEEERFAKYLTLCQLFLEFENHNQRYKVTNEGITVVPVNGSIDASLYSAPFADWALHETGLDFEIYMAISKANHQRFFRKFCPWYFKHTLE